MRIEMGTWVAIEARAPCAASAREGLAAAFAAVTEVVALMSPERSGSDLERLNRARCGVAVPVHEHTWRVLAFAQRLNRLSAGIFDPCLPEKPGTLQDLELTWKHAPAATCQAPLKLDLGGVAKGFAVDRAVKALRAAGCDAGLVNAGGDVRVFGTQAQTILLRGPRGALRALALSNGAVAVSDQDASQPPPGHRGYYARTRSLLPARRYSAVRAPDAMTADALTKCLLLCPDALAQALLNQLDSEDLA
jgi:thiamine biosynthesis lipoprotein